MAMRRIKKTNDYSIYKRGDDRYAVKDALNKPVSGDDKVKILLAEGLISLSQPAAPAEEAAPEEGAAESGEAAGDE